MSEKEEIKNDFTLDTANDYKLQEILDSEDQDLLSEQEQEVNYKVLLSYLSNELENNDVLYGTITDSFDRLSVDEYMLWGYSFTENNMGLNYDIKSPFGVNDKSRDHDERMENYRNFQILQNDVYNTMYTVIQIKKGGFDGWYLYLTKDKFNQPMVCLSKHYPFFWKRMWLNIHSFIFEKLDFFKFFFDNVWPDPC